jgi:hypothetical protein
MSPVAKYTLGRLGLFAVILIVLLPLPLNFLIKAMIALFASAGFSYFLLSRWRNEMAEQLASVAQRRQTEKARLRAALAGDEDAAASGDRAADPVDRAADSVDRPAQARDRAAETRDRQAGADGPAA